MNTKNTSVIYEIDTTEVIVLFTTQLVNGADLNFHPDTDFRDFIRST